MTTDAEKHGLTHGKPARPGQHGTQPGRRSQRQTKEDHEAKCNAADLHWIDAGRRGLGKRHHDR